MRLSRQLLLLAGVLVLIPWGGCQYLREVESALQASQHQAVLDNAKLLAQVFSAQDISATQADAIYFPQLSTRPKVDGYLDDWLQTGTQAGGNGFSLQHYAGTHEDQAYVAWHVHDQDIVYRNPSKLQIHDQIQVYFEQSSVNLATEAPGRLNQHCIWQDKGTSYVVECAWPLAQVQRGFGYRVFNSNGDSLGLGVPFKPVIPNQNAATQLQAVVGKSQRIWLVDRYGRVLAKVGDLPVLDQSGTSLEERLLLALGAIPNLLRDAQAPWSPTQTQLSGVELNAAQAGRPIVTERGGSDGRSRILSTAIQLPAASNTAQTTPQGAMLVVEQVDQATVLLTNRALARMMLYTTAILGIVFTVILAYATWLSLRIRRLAQGARAVWSNETGLKHGVKHHFPVSNAGDEIGELSRAFGALLTAVEGYTDYLKSLSGKLAHELRTPVAIVKSSLENLNASDPSNEQPYTQRALEGAARLNRIVQSMSEATRLEQSIATAGRETFDLAQVVAGCAQGYATMSAEHQIEIDVLPEPVPTDGSPELIAQMLDKLVDNARGFTPTGQTIRISLAKQDDGIVLSVDNDGPPLPDIAGNVFDSLVSHRSGSSETPHLGLGLYIVRLVAQFHHANVSAHNRQGGVCFMVRFSDHVATQKP